MVSTFLPGLCRSLSQLHLFCPRQWLFGSSSRLPRKLRLYYRCVVAIFVSEQVGPAFDVHPAGACSESISLTVSRNIL